MAEIKLTKNELRDQELRLSQLKRYLPTLQLKKAMLQTEVSAALQEINVLEQEGSKIEGEIDGFKELFCSPGAKLMFDASRIKEVKKRVENIAGADLPFFEEVIFEEFNYSLFDTPLWVDSAIASYKTLLFKKEEIAVVREKKKILEKELREVSIRVNLFEKVMIPRTNRNIKKIKVFLGDQQLASVAQAKVAKSKIEKKKAMV